MKEALNTKRRKSSINIMMILWQLETENTMSL